MINRYLATILLSAMVTIGLLANNTCFESIIANTPKNVTARYSYDIYLTNEYGSRTSVASYPCNSQLSGYLARRDIITFLDEGKLKSEEGWFEAILDVINLRKLQKNPILPWGASWWESVKDERNEKIAQKDKKFAKKWYKERRQKIEERNAAIEQWPSEYVDIRLNKLKKELIKRIKRIENQLKKQHYFDYTYLTLSAVGLAVTAALSYFVYYNYTMSSQKKAEFDSLINAFQKSGIKIYNNYSDLPSELTRWSFGIPPIIPFDFSWPYVEKLWIIGPDENNPEHKRQAERYSTLRKEIQKDSFFVDSLSAGTFAAISLFLTGKLFAIACDPNYDSEYLSKYKKLLRFIIYLEKQGYDDWRSKNRIADKELIAQ